MIESVYVLIVKKTISSDPFGKQIVIERKYILRTLVQCTRAVISSLHYYLI